MPAYYSLITETGAAQLTNALGLGGTIAFVEFAVGNGEDDAPYLPTEDQIALKGEVYRGQINAINRVAGQPNVLEINAIVPIANGGFTVREVGFFDGDGNLLVIANYPATFKPAVDQGAAQDLNIRVQMATSNTAQVELRIDPSIVLASQSFVNETVILAQAKVRHTVEDAEIVWDDNDNSQLTDAINQMVTSAAASSGGDTSIGKHTYGLPVKHWWATLGDRGADGPECATQGVNCPDAVYLRFDGGMEESAAIQIAMPKSWDGGPIQCQFMWHHEGSALQGVAFGFKAAFLSDKTRRTQTFGAEVVVTDAGDAPSYINSDGTSHYLYVSPVSADITPSGTTTPELVAAGGILSICMTRKVNHASDILPIDALLEHVRLTYTTNAETDD